MEYSNLFVVLMGLCTVFIGLICIIAIVTVMGKICTKLEKNPAADKQALPVAAAQQTTTPEMIAAVAAAIAEDMGADISAIRITSIKKI